MVSGLLGMGEASCCGDRRAGVEAEGNGPSSKARLQFHPFSDFMQETVPELVRVSAASQRSNPPKLYSLNGGRRSST
jgi:hypothetical protein